RYRATVPIRQYDQLRPFIDRAAAGEPQVLTREKPERFWKTTGTTSQPKKIPHTRSAQARMADSGMVVFGTTLHYFPEVNGRVDAVLTSHLSPKAIKEHLPGGFPFCSTTEAPLEIRPGHEHLMPPWLPGLQSVVEDDAERLYYLICFAALHDLLAI